MISKSITGILNSMVESIKLVIPLEVTVDKPSLLKEPFKQNDIGVLIAFTGDIHGRLMIDANKLTISNLGELMFGMAIEGEMLESFAGELSNMIAGNLATILTRHKIELDITPPTVIAGSSKIYGFERGFRLPVGVAEAGQLSVVLFYE